MNHGDKPNVKQQEKQKMLDELESLSRMLDEELDDDLDTPSRPVPDDVPVLKSFVDDVPVLSERFEEPPKPAPEQKTDSLDQTASNFRTMPSTRTGGQLDVSFLDKDPLEISAAVRERQGAPDLAIPTLKAVDLPVLNTTPVPTPRPEPAVVRPAPTAQAKPIAPSVSASFMTGAGNMVKPAAAAVPTPPASQPMTAATATQPLNRFQASDKAENPFLPKSTLDKIRENHANDASTELRKLIENNPLQKLSFDMAPNSREFQQLRQKASVMVNEVIRANMPRLEAELRLKLEQEVDRMFKELKKK